MQKEWDYHRGKGRKLPAADTLAVLSDKMSRTLALASLLQYT